MNRNVSEASILKDSGKGSDIESEGKEEKSIQEVIPIQIPNPESEAGTNKVQFAQKCHEELVKQEKTSINIINKLKGELDSQKKAIRDIRASKAADNLEKSELKEFFLNCVEEIRKDIVRKRSIAGSLASKTPNARSVGLSRVTSAGCLPKVSGLREKNIIGNIDNKGFTDTPDKKYCSLADL